MTSSAQHTNASPRNAVAAGIAIPTSSLGARASGGSSSPKPEYVTSDSGAVSASSDICVRVRSVIPVNMKNAPLASTELTM